MNKKVNATNPSSFTCSVNEAIISMDTDSTFIEPIMRDCKTLPTANFSLGSFELYPFATDKNTPKTTPAIATNGNSSLTMKPNQKGYIKVFHYN